MVKITDVARHAGVSTATVSRVLNNNARVAPELRRQVEESVRELGYKLNVAARSLRTQRSSKILVCVPDISNPFFADIIRGAEEAAREAGFSVMLGDTGGDPELEDLYAAMLERREVDGVFILGHRIPEPIRVLLDERNRDFQPIVHGCEYGPSIEIPSVHIDNMAAGGEPIRHLLDLGHREIGVITGPLDSPLSRDRLEGARVASHEVPDCRLHVREGDFSVQAGFDLTRELLGERATAIFCFSDMMAFGVLRALADEGRDCPGEVSVIGFDDIEMAGYAVPRLTTVAQPRFEIGVEGINLILRRLEGTLAETASIVLGHSLTLRDSTGPVAV